MARILIQSRGDTVPFHHADPGHLIQHGCPAVGSLYLFGIAGRIWALVYLVFSDLGLKVPEEIPEMTETDDKSSLHPDDFEPLSREPVTPGIDAQIAGLTSIGHAVYLYASRVFLARLAGHRSSMRDLLRRQLQARTAASDAAMERLLVQRDAPLAGRDVAAGQRDAALAGRDHPRCPTCRSGPNPFARVDGGSVSGHADLKIPVFPPAGTAGRVQPIGLPGGLAPLTVLPDLPGGIALIAGFHTRMVARALAPVLLGTDKYAFDRRGRAQMLRAPPLVVPDRI